MGTVTSMGTMPIDTRPEEQRDHVAIADVVTRAFGSPAEARLVDAIRSAPEYLPDLALVAVVDEKIVGHVMISRCLVADEAGDSPPLPAAMLSPLAVDPDHQGEGIGARLVREVTDRAAAAGHPFVVLEGDPRYYSRFGFEPAPTYGLCLPLPDWAPPEAAQVLRLHPDAPLPSGRVVYPEAFDVLDDE
jgi:putative acetyltransferase